MKARLGILVALGIILLPPAVFGQITMIATLSEGPANAEKPESERSVPIMLHPAAEPRPVAQIPTPPAVSRTPAGQCGSLVEPAPRGTDELLSPSSTRQGAYGKRSTSGWRSLWATRAKRSFATRPVSCADHVLFSDMERAARFESCDWELPFHEGGVIEMLLPELQQTRTYGRMLSAKARLEIAERKLRPGGADPANRLRLGAGRGEGPNPDPRPGGDGHRFDDDRPGPRVDPATRQPQPLLGPQHASPPAGRFPSRVRRGVAIPCISRSRICRTWTRSSCRPNSGVSCC